MTDTCIALDSLYTSAQETVLAILPSLTAIPSFIGSYLILHDILFHYRTTLVTVYHRLIFAMSLLDLLNSFGHIVLGSWTIPSNYEYGRSGRGNETTCTVSGWFFSLFWATMWYSAFLAFSFVMVIRWEWKERKIACCMEPFAHTLGFLLQFASGIYVATKEGYNPLWSLPGWCYVAVDPPFCDSNSKTPYCWEGQVIPRECDRGDGDELSGVTEGTVIFFWIVIIICMGSIVLRVIKMEKKMGKYAVGQNSFKRSKETAYRALCYIGAFFITFFPITVTLALTRDARFAIDHSGLVFFFALLAKITAPMIGLFNALIFFRKRFAKCMRPRQSLAWIPRIPILGPWVLHLATREKSHPSRRTQRSTAHSNASATPRNGFATDRHEEPNQEDEFNYGQELEDGNADENAIDAPQSTELTGEEKKTNDGKKTDSLDSPPLNDTSANNDTFTPQEEAAPEVLPNAEVHEAASP